MPLAPGNRGKRIEPGEAFLWWQVVMAIDEADRLAKPYQSRVQCRIVSLVGK